MRIRKEARPQPAATASTSRRSFIWKLGAGVSTAVASAAVAAGPEAAASDGAALRLALLEEEQALRELHTRFERALDHGRYEQALELFAADAEAVFNRGLFAGRDRGLSRLFRERFRAGQTGKRMEPAPGYAVADLEPGRVEVSADRLTATAAFPYSIQVGTPIETDSSLAGMARLHGEGVRTWWEGGVYDVTYRKDVATGRWQIGKLEYRTLSRADYRPGRTYASPIEVAPLAVRYPADPHGPDDIV